MFQVDHIVKTVVMSSFILTIISLGQIHTIAVLVQKLNTIIKLLL
jgi:hypothetical protein